MIEATPYSAVVAWGRPLGYTPEQRLHALLALDDGGSRVTVCRGRWSARPAGEIFLGATVTQWPKCVACCAITGDSPTMPVANRAQDWPGAYELLESFEHELSGEAG